MGVGACATSQQLESKSRTHLAQANAAVSIGDYQRAANEKEKAAKYHRKAVEKAVGEGSTSTVIVPVP